MPHQKGHPITYNHYFTETLQKIRSGRRESELSTALQQSFGVKDLKKPYLSDHSINLDELLKAILQQSEPNMVRFASIEALDCMLAYYKVALKRFIDDIANEVVEEELISSLSNILSPVTVFNMPADRITRIAGESRESQTLREQLNKELLILRKGSDTSEGSRSPPIVGDYPTSDISEESICDVRSFTEESGHSDSPIVQEDIPVTIDEISPPLPEPETRESSLSPKKKTKKKARKSISPLEAI
ncbi:hypothetical protein ASPSYDRAFT_95750 [Aspergillus sydowii CBS 593.65]|uniref:GED domain-containing protein n=1 Tax=Aspergillus sydowii CBS 593.65 TaxID=1036612 RepID=A0A1L9SYF9_9EURO|nr:uncharacterized protein ASPSYDRAFT_95750 [Aspergillus sydowii CBS 593.65]OJJ52215.1 hypothetical protein ASPSYDRAFT_95750 [Aspergillus sydowii CBS 593.65]